MNVDNINLLADTIEDHAKRKEGLRGIGFNMSLMAASTASYRRDHIDGCGTVACIAGWAVAVKRKAGAQRLLAIASALRIGIEAQHYLGLGDRQADALFCPSGVEWEVVTPRQAVRVLRHLAKTGEVDWSKRGRP